MRRATPAPRSWLWLQGLVCGAAAVASPGAALLAGILLIPAFAYACLVPARNSQVCRAMLLMGAASAVGPVRLLWAGGGSLDTALEILADPVRPLLSWSACGAGWLIAELASVSIGLLRDRRSKSAARSLQRERDGLIREWSAATHSD